MTQVPIATLRVGMRAFNSTQAVGVDVVVEGRVVAVLTTTEVLQAAWRIKPNINPMFYACKTLLSSVPDVNRRTIYRGTDHEQLLTMNQSMSPWTSAHDDMLGRLLQSLDEESLLNEAKTMPDVIFCRRKGDPA